MFLFLKSISTHVYSKFKDEIPPHDINSHKVVGGVPALVVLLRDDLHHFVPHSVDAVAVTVPHVDQAVVATDDVLSAWRQSLYKDQRTAWRKCHFCFVCRSAEQSRSYYYQDQGPAVP